MNSDEGSVSEIIPGLFVGDINIARNSDFMKSNNIKRIVNCTKHIPCYFRNLILYYQIPVNDTFLDSDILQTHLLPAVNFMMYPSKSNAVLIHCHAGISRSCTVAAAFIRLFYFPNIPDAINFVISKRHIAFSHGVEFRKVLENLFVI